MDDKPSKVRPFLRPSVGRDLIQTLPPTPPVMEPGEKLGLYPLSEDIVVSKPLFHLVVTALLHGTLEDRTKLACQLKEAVVAPFV